jgi:putative transposase
VREQFLVEVTDTTAEQLAEQGSSPAAALLELNALFTAWVESVYHHSVHSETGQTPLQRWDDGWQAAGHGPAMACPDALTEAFLWSQWRVVTKTATVSLHGNTYQVEPVLVGRKVELVFSPFNLEDITVHYQDAHYGRAVPHRITRHTHPKARPETPEPAPVPATGIAYLQLVADTHRQQVAADERIGFHALYSTGQTSPPQDEQLAGQLSTDDVLRQDAVIDDVTEQRAQAQA